MQPKRRISLALFLVTALLSAWFFPAFSSSSSGAASDPTETVLPGGMNGRTLLRSDEALHVQVGDDQGAHDITWTLDGRMVGKAPSFHLRHLPIGDHVMELDYHDVQDRLFSVTTVVRILEPGPYAIQVAAIQAAIFLPLWEEDSEVYLPSVQR